MSTSQPSPFEALLSQRAQHIRGPRAGGGGDAPVSFMYGFPAPECLPNLEVLAAADRALKNYGEWPLQYAGRPGYDALRDLLAAKLARDQGMRVSRDNILLTVGSSQGLALVADVLLDPGDVVLSEAPSFLGTLRMMANLGVDIRGIPLDDDGVRVDALESALKRLASEGKRAKLFYVIPNFQNPSGVTTTLERRKRIVELAREFGFAILEDDAYYDIRFAGQPLPPLFALDAGQRTFYSGTLSKILSPGLRLGWVVASEDMIHRLDTLKPDGPTTPFSVHTALEFSKDGRLDANIARLRAIYKRRSDIMLDALTEFMPEGVTWTQPQGGFFVWVTLPAQLDAAKLLDDTRKKGVDFLPGAACFPDDAGRNNIRLAFSYAPEDKLAEGISVIASAIRARLR